MCELDVRRATPVTPQSGISFSRYVPRFYLIHVPQARRVLALLWRRVRATGFESVAALRRGQVLRAVPEDRCVMMMRPVVCSEVREYRQREKRYCRSVSVCQRRR